MIEWIQSNWTLIAEVALILYAIAKVVVNLTPSENDNLLLTKVVAFIEKVIDLIIPNLKKGGGTHNKNLFKK
jgi:hypothetical protein